MGRSYYEISENRGPRRSRKAKELREVFEHAYDTAVQLIALRERHGLTQRELAERCGIDQGDISRIERGATSPTVRTLQRIADVLDADLRFVPRAQ
jgi:ribosome-binding protein aMBF1 (putative translation factor)